MVPKTEDGLKNIHFRVTRALWRRFRALYPDKGDILIVCTAALEQYIEEAERRERAEEANGDAT